MLSLSEYLRGLAGLGLHQPPISNPLGLKPCLADLYRKFVYVGQGFPEAILPGFVFEELECLVIEVFVILDEIHYNCLILVSQENISHLDLLSRFTG